jgi:hypothetical protein
MQFPFLPPPIIGEIYTAESRFSESKFLFALKGARPILGAVSSLAFICAYFYAQFSGVDWMKKSSAGLAFVMLSIYGFAIFSQIRKIVVPMFWKINQLRGICNYVAEFGFVEWTKRQEGYFESIELFEIGSHSLFQRVQLEDLYPFNLALIKKNGDQINCPVDDKLQSVKQDWSYSITIAWTKFLLRSARKALSTGGSWDFHVGQNLVFRFYANHIDLIAGSAPIRVVKADLLLFRFAYDWKIKFFIREDMSPKNGGQFLLPVEEIQNCAAFCILIETIFGIKMEGKKVDFLPKWHHGGW